MSPNWVKRPPAIPDGFFIKRILCTGEDTDSLYDAGDDIYGGVYGVYAEDVDGDGHPELIVGLTVGCVFYTADKRLAAALRGHSDRVRMISEYP